MKTEVINVVYQFEITYDDKDLESRNAAVIYAQSGCTLVSGRDGISAKMKTPGKIMETGVDPAKPTAPGAVAAVKSPRKATEPKLTYYVISTANQRLCRDGGYRSHARIGPGAKCAKPFLQKAAAFRAAQKYSQTTRPIVVGIPPYIRMDAGGNLTYKDSVTHPGRPAGIRNFQVFEDKGAVNEGRNSPRNNRRTAGTVEAEKGQAGSGIAIAQQ